VELQNAPFNLAEAADWKAMTLHLEVIAFQVRVRFRARRSGLTARLPPLGWAPIGEPFSQSNKKQGRVERMNRVVAR
jgi:hypothetical protein